jgi:hypothetical protein
MGGQTSSARRIVLWAVILASLVGIIVLITAPGRKQKAGVPPVTTWTDHTSGSGGFSLTYPQGWALKESNPHGVMTSFRVSQSDLNVLAVTKTMSLTADMARSRYTPEKLLEVIANEPGVLVAKSDGGNQTEYRQTAAGPTTLNERPAYEIQFTYTQRAGFSQTPMVGKSLTILTADSKYLIEVVGAQRDWPTLQPIYDRMLGSLRITGM